MSLSFLPSVYMLHLVHPSAAKSVDIISQVIFFLRGMKANTIMQMEHVAENSGFKRA
jgi:hypothetical protein